MTPTGQPDEYTVAGTEFVYNKMSELWIATHRTWHETRTTEGGIQVSVSNEVIQDIVEFRGVGRQRWMMRLRNTEDPYAPDPESAVWTMYDGDEPLADYTYNTNSGNPPQPTGQVGKVYFPGLAQSVSDPRITNSNSVRSPPRGRVSIRRSPDTQRIGNPRT